MSRLVTVRGWIEHSIWCPFSSNYTSGATQIHSIRSSTRYDTCTYTIFDFVHLTDRRVLQKNHSTPFRHPQPVMLKSITTGGEGESALLRRYCPPHAYHRHTRFRVTRGASLRYLVKVTMENYSAQVLGSSIIPAIEELVSMITLSNLYLPSN